MLGPEVPYIDSYSFELMHGGFAEILNWNPVMQSISQNQSDCRSTKKNHGPSLDLP